MGGVSLRVLAVLPTGTRTGRSPVWAQRQVESLRNLGVEVDIFPFANRRSPWGLFRGGLALRRAVRRLKPDLVHVHYAAAQALVAVLFSPRPIVVSLCGSDLLGHYDHRGRRTWHGRLTILLSQMAALGATRLIAKSEELRAKLWRPRSRAICEVIPNGVNLAEFRPMAQTEARRSLGWDHDDPVVLFIHRSGHWVKNPQLAAAAFRLARESIPALKMVVVENEPSARMPLFFNAADVLLLVSSHEGSSNSLKEAMASDLPVVATRCGDSADHLRGVRHCHVCNHDVAEIARRLEEVLSAHERSDGRMHIAHLDAPLVARRVMDCYHAALGSVARVPGVGKAEAATQRKAA
jgi:teichuronic acid biosynthesis glycosyltransferase TuaC